MTFGLRYFLSKYQVKSQKSELRGKQKRKVPNQMAKLKKLG